MTVDVDMPEYCENAYSYYSRSIYHEHEEESEISEESRMDELMGEIIDEV